MTVGGCYLMVLNKAEIFNWRSCKCSCLISRDHSCLSDNINKCDLLAPDVLCCYWFVFAKVYAPLV